MESTIADFLADLSVPVSKKYLRRLIQTHPDYPSLLAISDVLHRLSVPHIVRRIQQSDLIELPYPYILAINKGQGDLILIRSDKTLQKHKEDLSDWSGIVLQAESTQQVKDRTNNDLYALDRRITSLLISIGTLLSVFLLAQFTYQSWLDVAFPLTSLMGLIVAYFIIAKEFGVTYTPVEGFCNTGKVANCHSVLKSNVSILGLRLSNAVVMHFLFQFLALVTLIILPQFRHSFLTLLFAVSTSSLPVVGFSIYYQNSVVKSWCKLCLIISSILILQFVLFLTAWFFQDFQPIIPSAKEASTFVFLLFLVSLCFFLFETLLEHSTKLDRVATAGNRIKFTIEVFDHFLKKQPQIDQNPFDQELVIGNSDAPVKIIMVSNLYCNPCKLKHEAINELVSIYPDQVSVTLRFVESGNNDPKRSGAVRHLLAYWIANIASENDENVKTQHLISQWFHLFDFIRFKQRFPVNSEADDKAKLLEIQHYKWAEKSQVRRTPTFFVNGYELPNEYDIEDLSYMTIQLAEQARRKTTASFKNNCDFSI